GLGGVVVALAVELTRAGQLQPGHVMLCHCLVQQRAFGVTWVCTNAQYSAAIVWARKVQSPNRCQFGLCQRGLAAGLLARWWHIGTRPMRHFRRHADALAQRGVRVDGLA
ncbi:hypothetical protein, partial [Vibrio fluvialis]|uniref:hypothetical protein n=1 Tax=Vibrio fluvialis TaxID=676 RepID=UPI00301BF2D0